MKAQAGSPAQKVLSLYPLKTSTTPCPNEAQDAPGALGHIACAHVADPIGAPQHNYYGRIDHNFSGSDRVSFTLNMTRMNTTELYGGGNPSNLTPISSQEPQHNHNLALVETHIFNPRILNEFTLAHNRHYDNYFQGTGNYQTPEILIGGADYGLGLTFGPYSERVVEAFSQDRWQIGDNMSWTSDSNFTSDFPYFMETSINPQTGAKADAYRHYASKDTNLFFQDDWKLSRRLTLNLGLRWEQFGAP